MDLSAERLGQPSAGPGSCPGPPLHLPSAGGQRRRQKRVLCLVGPVVCGPGCLDPGAERCGGAARRGRSAAAGRPSELGWEGRESRAAQRQDRIVGERLGWGDSALLEAGRQGLGRRVAGETAGSGGGVRGSDWGPAGERGGMSSCFTEESTGSKGQREFDCVVRLWNPAEEALASAARAPASPSSSDHELFPGGDGLLTSCSLLLHLPGYPSLGTTRSFFFF